MTFDLMEIQFPYLVEQEICAKEIEIDEILDGKIGIHFTVNKIDQSNYSINGKINATLTMECNNCFDLINIELNISTKLSLLDSKDEPLNQNNFQDIHYQSLDSFSLTRVIREEVLLNLPLSVFCNKAGCINNFKKKDSKENPFKKLKDLL
jgi:uncharacterized metal-binding protein YceD (DUF177 family)